MKHSIAALALVFAVTGIAHAQYEAPKGISVRGGIFLPSNGDAQGAGKTWFGLGVDYQINNKGTKVVAGQALNTSYSISLDWIGRGNYTNIPVLFNVTGRQSQMYYSAGAGLAIQRTPAVPTGTDSNTRFAFQLSVGMDLNKSENAYFVEARYFGGTAKLAGFGVFGGIRF